MRTEEKYVTVEVKGFILPKVGDIVYKHIDERGNEYLANDEMLAEWGSGLVEEDTDNWKFKVVPFEIYNSPLYKIMNEVDDDTVC